MSSHLARRLTCLNPSLTVSGQNAYVLSRNYATADHLRRNYVSELHRPPPPTQEPTAETFSSTSKPRPYHGRGPPRTDLPMIEVMTRLSYRVQVNDELNKSLPSEKMAIHTGIRVSRYNSLGVLPIIRYKSGETV